MKKNILTVAAVATLGLALAGCSPREERIVAGAGVGAAAGAVIGGLATGSGRGALAGAAIGGASGAIIADATRPNYRCWYDTRGRRVCQRIR
jgi:hypothetical protein